MNLTFIYNYICMLFTTLILILKTIYNFAYLSCFMDIHNFLISIVKQDKYIDYVFCSDDICALIKFVIEKYMLQANVLDFPTSNVKKQRNPIDHFIAL